MDKKIIRNGAIQWKAKYLSRLWARWLRKTGKSIDGQKIRELECDLALLLRKYQDEWGISVVGLRLDPVVVSIRKSKTTDATRENIAVCSEPSRDLPVERVA